MLEVRIVRARADGNWRTGDRAAYEPEASRGESIAIMRDVVAEAVRRVALEAFYPGKPPFPLLHIDTTWKFREMYELRDRTARELGLELLVRINQDARKRRGESIRVFPLSNWTELDVWHYICRERIPVVLLHLAADAIALGTRA